MDLDDDLRAALKHLARPRSVPQRLRVDRVTRTRSTRRRRRVELGVVGAVVAVLMILGTPPLLGRLHPGPPSSSGAHGVGWRVTFTNTLRPNPYVSSDGVHAELIVRFKETRTITSGRVVGARRRAVYFQPRDGTDSDSGYPLPLKIPRGISFFMDGYLMPACTSSASSTVPDFVVTSRDQDGSERTNTAPVSTPKAWRRALTRWCAKGVQAIVHEMTTLADGDQKRVLTLINPGARPVVVVSKGTGHPGRGWSRAEVVVPPAGTRHLTIRGVDTRGLPLPALFADGKPLHLTDQP